MNALTNLIAKFAAGAVLLGTVAYAQGPAVKAKIPFDFHTSNGALPAGVYVIKAEASSSSVNVTSLRNLETRKTVFAVRITGDYKPANAGKPAVMFLCGERGCALTGVRMDDGSTSYYPNHQNARDKEVAIVAVSVHSLKAD